MLGLDWWEFSSPINPSDYTLYEKKEAEDVMAVYRVNVYSWGLGYFGRGEFVAYDNIWFGEVGEVRKMLVRYSKGNNGGRMEFRLDHRYGPGKSELVLFYV